MSRLFVKADKEGHILAVSRVEELPEGHENPFYDETDKSVEIIETITDPLIPINQGCYRPVEIICPEGTVLNCTYPASVVSGVTETSPRIIDMLLRTLSQAIPDRVVAQNNCAACTGVFSGTDPVEERTRAFRLAPAALTQRAQQQRPLESAYFIFVRMAKLRPIRTRA